MRPMTRLALGSLALAIAGLGCSDGTLAPYATLDGELEIRVLDDTVYVTRHAVYPQVTFVPRLQLHNRSRDLSLRWGGCAWLDLRDNADESALDRICSTELRPDDRPVLKPGETVVIEWPFHVCTGLNCAPRMDLDRIDGTYRFVAHFGPHQEAGLRELTGTSAHGSSGSNQFTLKVVE